VGAVEQYAKFYDGMGQYYSPAAGTGSRKAWEGKRMGQRRETQVRKVLPIILFLLLPLQVFGTTYYVDTTCTDSNPASGTVDGTAYNPAGPSCTGGSASYYVSVADINAAAGTLVPGDTISFRRGQTWRATLTIPESGTSGNVYTYNAFGSGANPVITGADVFTSWTSEDQGGWTAYYATSTMDPYIVMEDGTNLYPIVASKAALTAGTYWWDDPNDRVYIRTTGDDAPSGYTIEMAQRSNNGIIVLDNRSYITIDGIDVRYSRDAGTSNYTTSGTQTNVTIKNLKSSYQAGEGVIFSGNNTFYNTTIDTVEVAYVNLRPGCNAGQAISFWSDTPPNSADGIEIKNCNIHNQKEEAIMLGGGAKNGSVHHNIVHDFEGSCGSRPGFYVMNVDNIDLYNNAVYNHHDTATPGWAYCFGIAIEGWMGISTINDVQFSYNLCYDSDAGVSIYKKSTDTISNIRILNNTFANLDHPSYAYQFHSSLDTNYSGTNTIRNNIFWDIAGSNVFLDGTTGNSAIAATTITNNLFQTGDSSETFGSSYVQTADVKFTNYAGKNFTLQSDSPAKNAGVDVGLTSDYAGNTVPSGANPDIGAYEFQEGVPVLVSPVDTSTGLAFPITFTWQAVAGADLYQLQVDDDSGFGSPEIDIETTDTEYIADTDDLKMGVHYYWRVRARR
jgi:hypothetical protein